MTCMPTIFAFSIPIDYNRDQTRNLQLTRWALKDVQQLTFEHFLKFKIHWCAKLKQQCKNLADSNEIAEKEVWRSVQ
ncbi:hypothetical protein TNCV_3459801 [Trichonephila clavipes]|nr:hypothetical protein TNCV_3459801 [Trichonephila clavipes]